MEENSEEYEGDPEVYHKYFKGQEKLYVSFLALGTDEDYDLYAEEKYGALFVVLQRKADGKWFFFYPLGRTDKKAFDEIDEYALQNMISPRFVLLNERQKKRIGRLYPHLAREEDAFFIEDFLVSNNIDLIARFASVPIAEGLIAVPLVSKYAEDYFALASDEANNRFWGYDYKKDFPDGGNPEVLFRSLRKDFADRKEWSLALLLDGKMIGEMLLRHFEDDNSAEIGIRLFKEQQGKGYGSQAVQAFCRYLFDTLHFSSLRMSCCKENLASAKMIKRCGFSRTEEKDGCLFFERKAGK